MAQTIQKTLKMELAAPHQSATTIFDVTSETELENIVQYFSEEPRSHEWRKSVIPAQMSALLQLGRAMSDAARNAVCEVKLGGEYNVTDLIEVLKTLGSKLRRIDIDCLQHTTALYMRLHCSALRHLSLDAQSEHGQRVISFLLQKCGPVLEVSELHIRIVTDSKVIVLLFVI